MPTIITANKIDYTTIVDGKEEENHWIRKSVIFLTLLVCLGLYITTNNNIHFVHDESVAATSSLVRSGAGASTGADVRGGSITTSISVINDNTDIDARATLRDNYFRFTHGGKTVKQTATEGPHGITGGQPWDGTSTTYDGRLLVKAGRKGSIVVGNEFMDLAISHSPICVFVQSVLTREDTLNWWVTLSVDLEGYGTINELSFGQGDFFMGQHNVWYLISPNCRMDFKDRKMVCRTSVEGVCVQIGPFVGFKKNEATIDHIDCDRTLEPTPEPTQPPTPSPSPFTPKAHTYCDSTVTHPHHEYCPSGKKCPNCGSKRCVCPV